MGTLANLSVGQTYRVVDLGEPISDTGTSQIVPCPEGQARAVRAHAINEKGQIVGVALCTDEFGGTLSSRAFYWLPEPAYGLSIEQVKLLTPQGSPGHDAANDLNNSGFVAGWTGTTSQPSTATDAVAWQLGSPLGSFSTIALPASTIQAWAVNNALVFGSYYHVVGDAEDMIGLQAGFLWPGASGPSSVTALAPLISDPTPWQEARARAINTPATGDALIGGHSFTGCMEACRECNDPDSDATVWQPTSTPAKLAQPPSFQQPIPPFDEFEGEVRGVNDSSNLVGWGLESAGNCIQRGLYWEDKADAAPDVLQAAIPTQHTFANAINNTLPRRAVGQNVDAQRAARWELDGIWFYTNLTDQINVSACGWLSLNEATDIATVALSGHNCGDWIVGWGKRNGSGDPKTRAFLLIPLSECPGDTNCDNTVNILDYNNVMADWGTCDDGELCLGDTNGDCVVNQVDRDTVRNNYGPCGSGFAGGPPQVEAIVDLFVASPTPEMADFAISMLWAFSQAD